jgi:membrane protein implicated in regulation of membrane protease activity
MIYIDLFVLIVIVSLISVWLDRRFLRKQKGGTSNGA